MQYFKLFLQFGLVVTRSQNISASLYWDQCRATTLLETNVLPTSEKSKLISYWAHLGCDHI